MPNYLIYTDHLLGEGTYGKVYLGKDLDSNKKVAIKRLTYSKDSLNNLLSLYREVAILRHFDHPNVISLEQVRVDTEKSQIDLIFEHMPCDLHSIIHERAKDGSLQPLTHQHIDFFLYQILSATNALHSKNIMHRDLKPQNMVVDRSYHIKLIDFGDARLVPDPSSPVGQRNLTRQRMTIPYRAPEILVENKYGTPADMWSVGCILGELLLRKRFFYDKDNGQNATKQMAFIFHLLGEPLPAKYEWIENLETLHFIQGLCRQYKDNNKKPLSHLFEHATPLQRSFLNGMFEFNPNLRMSAETALNCFSPKSVSETTSHVPVLDTSSTAAEKERSWRKYNALERKLDVRNTKYIKPDADDIMVMETLIKKESKGLAASRGTLFHPSSSTATGTQDGLKKQQENTDERTVSKARADEEEKIVATGCSPK